LPSIKVELSEKELDAVAEFARLCGESIPDLMRKLAIRDATLADGYGADDSSYDFRMILPVEGHASSDREVIERSYNRVRRILGWKEICL
jgi:hypothetical protein